MLIIVAGMNYAAYVEAVEGKTVLASGELYARKALEEVFFLQDSIFVFMFA